MSTENVMNTLEVNNALRLQWELEIQYLPSLHELFPFPSMYGDKVAMSASDAMVTMRALLNRALYVSRTATKQRIIGPAAMIADLDFQNLKAAPPRDSSTIAGMKWLLQKVQFLEYERYLSGLPTDVWLPVQFETNSDELSEAQVIHEIERRLVKLKSAPAVVNRRDQLKELQLCIARFQTKHAVELGESNIEGEALKASVDRMFENMLDELMAMKQDCKDDSVVSVTGMLSVIDRNRTNIVSQISDYVSRSKNEHQE